MLFRSAPTSLSSTRAAVAKGMSVRVLEQTVRAINSAGSEAKEKAEKEQKTSVKVDYIRALQNKMTSVLGRKVRIHSSGKNKKIEIHYSDNDDLSQIIKLLCGENIFDEI